MQGKWEIGQRVCTDQNYEKIQGQKGKTSFIQQMARDIGLGKSDMYYCVEFYEKFPETNFSNVLERLGYGSKVSWRKVIAEKLPENILV